SCCSEHMHENSVAGPSRGDPGMSTGTTARTTTRRTALTGLGALGVATTAGACSLLPGGDEAPVGETDPAPDDAGSDGGGASPKTGPGAGTSLQQRSTRQGRR